ncbi:MAG: SirB2 family protein [Betaproteobacteria bacterium]|nr:SirB2 family protein [Betaproteobacteria bacterium]
MYLFVKHLHVGCVVLSGLGFALRGIWMALGSPMLNRRWVRIVPHVVDTVLLGSALTLIVLLGQYPFVDGWLTAKILGLLAYIGLGTVALRRGRSRRVRVAAWLAAMAIFGYIVSVALVRAPAGLFNVVLGAGGT